MYVAFNFTSQNFVELKLIHNTDFFKAKPWITSDMKVWINTALLTFLITEHIYSYNNIFFNDFFPTYLHCI